MLHIQIAQNIQCTNKHTCVCVCVRVLPATATPSTDCLSSWAKLKSGSSIETATVVELKVKVPPGALGSGKMTNEDLFTRTFQNLGRFLFQTYFYLALFDDEL